MKTKFKYDFETTNGMWVVEKERLIKLNAKKYNLSLDFSHSNTLYAKRDLIVFITYNQDDNILQLIVNNHTNFDKSPKKELTDYAKNFVGKMSLQDFIIFNNYKNKKQ
jgi:hypothetical protein